MISRRDFLEVTAGLTSAGWLRAQDVQPVFWVKLRLEVTDGRGNHINGLKPSDFRVLEDGILQKISTFAEGAKPPLLVNEDGATRPLVDGQAAAGEADKPGFDLAFESFVDLGNSYTVTYYPRPNPNQGFRKIIVEITSDAGKKYRVRSRPGYRPRAF